MISEDYKNAMLVLARKQYPRRYYSMATDEQLLRWLHEDVGEKLRAVVRANS